MILLSNSIPKTGSTLLASYQEDMLEASGIRSGQDALRLAFGGRFLPKPTGPVLVSLARTSFLRGSLVVKCHWPFERRLHVFCQLLKVRMTFAYRDPRDMILSMIDHGERTRNGGDPSGAYSHCISVEGVVPHVLAMMESFRIWKHRKYVRPVRYEDLVSNPVDVLDGINAFLGWKLERTRLIEMVEQRERNKVSSHNFNKGTTERWKTEMNSAQKDLCRKRFEPYLVELGYELE